VSCGYLLVEYILYILLKINGPEVWQGSALAKLNYDTTKTH
jgi:hypothetical protein